MLHDLLGYLSAVVIGITLGLMGGGGSILTVPAMVYLIGINPVVSTAYSLYVVGSSSLIGAFSYMKRGLLCYKTAIIFAIPSFIAVYLTRKFLVPAIPDELFTVGSFVFTKDVGVMVFFAVIMMAASYSMIRKGRPVPHNAEGVTYNFPLIFLEGAVVGVITGIVGAGGGFLIVPALVLLAHLPMRLAVGTSLLIIAAKSLIGFLGDLGNQPIDWRFLLTFTGLTIVGILLGSYLNRFVPAAKLKQAFGWFVLVMGVFIFVKELAFPA